MVIEAVLRKTAGHMAGLSAGMRRGHCGTLLTGFLLPVLLALCAPAGLAQRPPNDAPAVQLDAIFATNELPQIAPKELATRYLQMEMRKGSVSPPSLGFRRIPREGGRKATLFGLEVDEAYFSFRGEKVAYINVHFLNRERGMRMSRPEFDKLLGQCTEAISKKTGVAPVKVGKPEPPGATIDVSYQWPKTAFALHSSYRVEDAVRRVPFQRNISH